LYRNSDVEIERKWILERFPDNPSDNATLYDTYYAEQSYLSINPEIRLIKHIRSNGSVVYKLCVKSEGTIEREETELVISEDQYNKLSKIINKDVITKHASIYKLSDGRKLIVSEVDKGKNTKFIYGEIEFNTLDDAVNYKLPLNATDVTYNDFYKMKNYWFRTR